MFVWQNEQLGARERGGMWKGRFALKEERERKKERRVKEM